MKRRDFAILAGAGIAAAASDRPVAQAAPDATLLTTTLTPVGAERAGNADGSIPAWNGPLQVPPGTPTRMPVFTDENPLYTVNSSNLSEYQALVPPGVSAMITKYAYSLDVYQTHRTAGMPQYVYDNTAKNVATAQLNPNGGRLGFSGAYGGVPFPVIDTSLDPLVVGAQLIWNHLLAFQGYSYYVTMAPSMVVSNGHMVLSEGSFTRFNFPYFDPNGSLETYQGYYSKTHNTYYVPAAQNGEENLTWHTSNVSSQQDITWSLLNGQGRVRKAPDEAYDTPNPATNGIGNIDESIGFYGNPSQYDWKYIGKQEMLIPYNCNSAQFVPASELVLSTYPNPKYIRWEKHRVWVIEATLHPGERNVLAKRRFYLDEDTWNIVLGESYDADGNMVKVYIVALKTTPVVPVNVFQLEVTFNLLTGDYYLLARSDWPGYPSQDVFAPQPESDFESQAMAANASF